jgi:hypothetical protein
MKRLVPVLVAAVAFAIPAAAGAATNSVDITYDPAACTASITVGLGQHLDPRLEWFQTIDDHRAGPFPGMVRVEARARWRVCGRTRTVVRVVRRRQLDP